MLAVDEESLSAAMVSEQSSSLRRLGVRAALAGTALAGCCAAVLLHLSRSSGAVVADIGNAVGLQSEALFRDQIASAGGGEPGATNAYLVEGLPKPPPESVELNHYFNMMMGVPGSSVSKEEQSCLPTEELFQNLCYRKCKLLTNGTFPLRTSAWTCCQAAEVKDCFFSNQDKNLGICSGYDVSGDGKSCPRAPGKCKEDEEMLLGQCYKKCSLLTNGEKPFRTSAISCCRTPMALSCFMPSNVAVNAGYA